MKYKHFFYPNFIFMGFLAFLGGCAPIVDVRGNFPDPQVLQLLEIGAHNKDHLRELLGPPSTVDPFNKNTWIYMGQRTETLSFFEPEVLEQKIILLNFDTNDVLNSIEEIDSKKTLSFPFVARETPTSGHDTSFLQELFGSFGKFNRPLGDEKKSS